MIYLNPRTMEKSEGRNPSDLSPVATKPQENVFQEQGYTMSQDLDFAVEENVILQTKNYSIFSFDPLNRPIKQDKVDRLYDAVKTKNLLHLFPIVVTRWFVIIDGQHRFKVAEALDTPIYFIVSSQMQVEDAAQVNVNVSLWKGADYLDHWCKMQLPDYLTFRDFVESNPFLSFSAALRILGYGAREGKADISLTQRFRVGKFQVANLPRAVMVANMARDFARWVNFWRETSFLLALTILAASEDYDHRRMMQKMEYLSTRLVRCPDTKSYIQVMEAIYNYKAADGNRMHFPTDGRKHAAKSGASD